MNACDKMMSIAASSEVLDFNDFLRSKNNFHLRFADGMFKPLYWRQPVFVEASAQSSKFLEVAEKLFPREDYSSDEYLDLLYLAYTLIRPYAKTNWELFI